jgi:hypothetical protein
MTGNSTVVRPSWAWFALLDGGIVALGVLAYRGEESRESRREGRRENGGAGTRVGPVTLPSRRVLRGMLAGTAVIHAAEALAAARVARRRGLSAWGWGGQTLVVGFPSLLALRRASAHLGPARLG